MDFQNLKLSKAQTYTLRSMPRGKQHKQPITNSCNIPFTHLTVDQNSDCFLCKCDGWLPIPIGKITDFESLEDAWNSPISKDLQADIQEKKFSWCAVEHCGVIDQNVVNSTYTLNINIDDSCNLACPSCRREPYMLEHGPKFDSKTADLTHILEWLEKFNHPITISLGGTGDALASKLMRNLIKNYCYKPGQQFRSTTNGLLLKKVIADSNMQSAISQFSISVDAGSKEVYEQVRRPGKWSALIENLEWLSNNRQQSKVTLNFVLQKTNFRDLPAFAQLCTQLKFGGNVQPLNDWGTWNSRPVVNPDAYTIANGTYVDHNVANSVHPEHTEFLTVLRNTREQHKNLHISPYFNKFK